MPILEIGPEGATATFSVDRQYRYWLTRDLVPDPRRWVAFVGLNPSTADAYQLDPTVRRCVGYAKDWGYEGFMMLNLFGYRATDPRDLYEQEDMVGLENDKVLHDALRHFEPDVICAWGSNKAIKRDGDRAQAVREIIREEEVPCYFLRMNKDGQPAHPLYLPKDLRRIPYV